MKKLFLLLTICASAFAQINYQTVIANTVTDASGAPLASGQICFQGVADNGQPIPFRAPGGGVIHTERVCANVGGGVMAPLAIANSQLTYPVNVAYAITIIDNTTGEVISTLGPTQISCTITVPTLNPACQGIVNNPLWDLNLFQPGNSPLAIIQNGPPGPPGPTGPAGPPGTITATGTAGSFDVPGFLLTGKGPLIDVTESTYGADKTGATDATAAIQSAITYCEANGGGTVYLPIGTYKIATTAGVIVSKPYCNFVGASRMGTIINATNGGPGVSIQMNPFVSTGAGHYGKFTIVGTASGTIGLKTGSIVGGTFEDILVYGYTTGIGIDLQNRIDLFPSGGGAWTERNTFQNVQAGGVSASNNNLKGWNLEVIGGGTSVSFGYNRFLNIQGNANSGQVVFNVSSPSFLYHSTIILTCNLGDGPSFSTNPICIHSDGNSDQNWSQITGEYNGVHAAYSIDGTRFVSTGSVDVTLATMHFTGTSDNAPRMRVTSGIEANTADAGTYTEAPSSTVLTPSIFASDHQGYSNIGLFSGTGVNSPFVTMFEAANNKFIVCSVPFATALSGCHERWSADSGGNTFQTGGLWVGFTSFSSIASGYTAQINGGLLVRGTAGVQLSALGATNLGGATSSQRAGWYDLFLSGTTGINESLGFGDSNWSSGFGSVQGSNIAHPISWGLLADPYAYEFYAKRFATPLASTDKVADVRITGMGDFQGVSLLTAQSQPTCGASIRGVLWFINAGSGTDGLQVCQSTGGAYSWKVIF
jgi:hypothetical protein